MSEQRIRLAPADSVPPAYQQYVTSLAVTNDYLEELSSTSGYVYAITDEAGRVALGITADGTVVARLTVADGTVKLGTLAAEVASLVHQPMPITSGYVWAITDQDGRVALGVRSDGTIAGTIDRALNVPEVSTEIDPTSVYVQTTGSDGARQLVAHNLDTGHSVPLTTTGDNELITVGRDGAVLYRHTEGATTTNLSVPASGGTPYPATSLDDWAMWGDSLTANNQVPDRLATLLGRPVYNGGIGSQRSYEIATRQGGTNAAVTVSGDAIPASGAVSVTAVTPDPNTPAGPRSIRGTLAGVPGVLAKAADGTNSFTRDAAGSAVSCPPGTPFVSEPGQTYASRSQIYWPGRNDVSSDDVSRVASSTAAMVEHHLAHFKRFVVLSITTATSEPQGSARYGMAVAANQELAAIYGDRFIDVRRYVIDHALADMGVTPTANDLACIAADTCPPSVMIAGTGLDGRDNIHFSPEANIVIANFVFTKIQGLGWAA